MASAFSAADHERSHALEVTKVQCTAQGLRLTEGRQRVLAVLWDDHCPVSAYGILDRLNTHLSASNPGAKPLAPPMVYRALEFLIAHGLAHKLNSLNAYIGCAYPGRQHRAQFFICRTCHAAAEVRSDAISREIKNTASDLEFQAETPLVEVEGLCSRCRSLGPAPQEGGHRQ